MDFVSIRVITDDVARLAGFYEKATGVEPTWYTEDFAELRTAHATLAIGSTRTVPLFAPGVARPADNHTVIIEFLVDDVDDVHQKLTASGTDLVSEPTTMPWGNRSLLVRDPDGTLVNFFSPVTPAAIEKFARYLVGPGGQPRRCLFERLHLPGPGHLGDPQPQQRVASRQLLDRRVHLAEGIVAVVPMRVVLPLSLRALVRIVVGVDIT